MIIILLKNELYKIMKKKKIYIFIILIIFLCMLQVGISYKYDDSKELDWKGSAEAQIEYAEEYCEQYVGEKESEEYREVQKQKKMAEYILDNNLSSMYKRTYWSSVFDSLDLMIIITIMTIMICCDVFCEDYSLRTIKLLFTRPNKRRDLWISKILSIIIIFWVMSFVLMVTSSIINMLLYDCFESRQSIIYLNNYGKIVEKSYFVYLLENYLTIFLEAIGYILLTAVCAVLFKNSSVATTISVVALLGSSIVISIYEQKMELLKYSLFYNIDLSQYLNCGENYWKTTVLFSAMIIILHYLLFFFIGNRIYCKQEIY